MNIGVLYFNRGTSCYVRLATSIFSLRKHYQGPVTVMQEGALSPSIAKLLDQLKVQIHPLPEPMEKVLVKKTSLWRDMPFDRAMYLDADTLVRAPVDEFLGWAAEREYVAAWFNGWLTSGTRMRKRMEEWSKVCPELVGPALAYGKAVNSGVQGLSKISTLLPAHEELARLGDVAACNGLVLDELAIQLLLPRHPHFLAHHVWNTSGVFGDVKQAKIIHYHGRKHCLPDNPRCDLWKDCYFELLSSFPNARTCLNESWGDRRLKAFLKTVDRPRRDLTVVTAVDPAYAAKLKRNLRKWLELPGLRNQQFLVFVNGFRGPRERRFLKHPNVRVVRWDYPHAGVSRREFMLAAFVFGTARHVKTAFWMKLDADAEPQRPWWKWPDYPAYTIVSHRWNYTRIKGDTGASGHWFNRLDDCFRPGCRYFQKAYNAAESTVSHRPDNPDHLPRRFNSYCHIERTKFTRRIAEVLEANFGGRMPIPSHDTTAWYCAQIWREKVKLRNMKVWFRN